MRVESLLDGFFLGPGTDLASSSAEDISAIVADAVYQADIREQVVRDFVSIYRTLISRLVGKVLQQSPETLLTVAVQAS